MGSDVQPGTLRELAGEPLDKILARGGPLPLASVTDVVDRVGTALAGAQAAGRVPADLQALIAAARQTSSTDAVDALDAAAAQLWLAALAYNLLAGHPVPRPDAGPSVPKPIRAYRPEVPAETEAVVFRGLNPDHQRRFSSVAEFASALRRSTAARLEQDDEERTTVSAVPSGIAARLRQSGLSLPDDERTVVSPSANNDELTVVSASSRPDVPPVLGPSEHQRVPLTMTTATMFTPTQQVPRVRGRQPPRRLWIVACGAVLAVGAFVTWRAVAGRAQPPPPAPPVPVARAAPPAPGASARPVVAVRPPPPSASPAAAIAPPAPPTPEPSLAEQAAAPASRGRPPHAHGHARSRVAVSEPAPSAAPDGPKSCRLSVASYPWAELWVDGADTGLQTPVVGFAISCGRHRLEFKRRDLNVDQIESVTLSDGIEFKRQYELKGAELDD